MTNYKVTVLNKAVTPHPNLPNNGHARVVDWKYQHNIKDFTSYVDYSDNIKFAHKGAFSDIRVGGFLVYCSNVHLEVGDTPRHSFTVNFMQVVSIDKGKIYVADANGTYGLYMCHLKSRGAPYVDSLSKKPSSCHSISNYVDALPLVDGLIEADIDYGRLYHW